MGRRYLLGPATAAWADDHLPRRHSGECLTFGPAGGEIALRPGNDWAAALGRLPDGWRPDFVALWLGGGNAPTMLLSAPVPVVALATDWDLHWHAYRHLLPCCDLALAGPAGAAALARAGLDNVRPAPLFGFGRSALAPAEPTERDIDVLLAGPLHCGLLPLAGRLARLGGRWSVAIDGARGDGVDPARARAVVCRGRAGEAPHQALKALAAGALLFVERGNAELGPLLRDGAECVFYSDGDLEGLLGHYLGDERRRESVAAAGRARAAALTAQALWGDTLAAVEAEWEQLQQRAARRPPLDAGAALRGRCWLAWGRAADPQLVTDLARAAAARPGEAALHNALGLALGAGSAARSGAGAAAEHFRRAVAADPALVPAGLNLAEALAQLGQDADAADAARRALAALEHLEGFSPALLDCGHFPPACDTFRIEWERAAWASAGDAGAEAREKARLLRWRLHLLLGAVTGELLHHHEAALARPDLPATRAALGCALGRAGRPTEALPPLRAALDADPLDRAAAHALLAALGETGDAAGQACLAAELRLLNRALRPLSADDWFALPPAAAPPAEAGLASIIIVCCGQVDYTRQCLESLLTHTRPPYELILVDNGSTDGTPAALRRSQAAPGPHRVEVVRSETNLGFAAGCNWGLAAARGRYLVLLNNDTLLTDGWLDGLLARLQGEGAAGLAGPVTNNAPDPQHVAAGYDSPAGLAEFAAERRREWAGRDLGVERLTGFCLALRREVLGAVGALDEGFGPGFFEDDDLCLRARRAGFRLVVALDVYIHHHGSRTFAGLGIDPGRQLQENLARFRAKWGEQEAARYSAPGPQQAAPAPRAPTAGRLRVSLCLIVRDEEHNLPECLGPVANLVDEVVVVDTGSRDRTREVAAALGARVFDFPWVDDFAAARNESLRRATGEWVFWMDADDRLDADNTERLRALLADLSGGNVAYVMRCLCPPGPEGGAATAVDHVRLFRRLPGLRWRYRVHEQILPALREAGAEVRWCDVEVLHTGYQDPARRPGKLERDLRLLRLQEAERPDDPFTLFNLGWTLCELGRPEGALPLLVRSLASSGPVDSIVRKLHALVVQCQRALGRPAEAMAACLRGLGECPGDAELLYEAARLHLEAGEAAAAEACLVGRLSLS